MPLLLPAPDPETSGAIIGAAGVVVGAVLAGVIQFERERAVRRNERQVESLRALSEAALDVRLVLQDVGRVLRPTAKQVASLDRARGTFQLCREAVRLERVRRVATAWYDVAERYYIGTETVTASEEAAAWRKFVGAVGLEVRTRY